MPGRLGFEHGSPCGASCFLGCRVLNTRRPGPLHQQHCVVHNIYFAKPRRSTLTPYPNPVELRTRTAGVEKLLVRKKNWYGLAVEGVGAHSRAEVCHRRYEHTGCRVPYVTQDNTPLGPIFKARLLHIRINVDIKQGVVGKISPTAFRKRVYWYWNRAGCGVTEL